MRRIAILLAVLDISDRAVATSGNYRRGFDIGGQHYSHIVDPRTGRTAEEIIGATVVAPKAVDAGALATAFCVLSPEESRKLAASVPGVEYMLVEKDGAQIRERRMERVADAARAVVRGGGSSEQVRDTRRRIAAQWNPGYELTVNVEIPQTQGFGARRPYVAVWIEDKDHFPVRTLAVWFQKERWLNELRAWYRDDRLRAHVRRNRNPELGDQRDALSRQIHVQMGRQGQQRQAGQSRAGTRAGGGRARTRRLHSGSPAR